MTETRRIGGDTAKLEGRTLKGYAIVYNSLSRDLGGFVERFMPGSITETIRSGTIEAWLYHDSSLPIGSQAAGTLRLWEDAKGMPYELDLPDTTYANDFAVLAQRGDVGGTSFGFRPVPNGGERWLRANGENVREIIKADIGHIAPVITPAYAATTANLRSLHNEETLEAADFYGIDLKKLTNIFVARSKGLTITNDERQVAREAIKQLKPYLAMSALDVAELKASKILI